MRLLHALPRVYGRVRLMRRDVATFFSGLLLLHLRRVVARLLHLCALPIIDLFIYLALILQGFRHFSLVLPRYLLLLYLLQPGEQLVQMHRIGQVEEGQVRDRRHFCHESLAHLVWLLLDVLLVVFETDQISLLNEIRLLIRRHLLNHYLRLLKLIVVPRKCLHGI